MFTLPQTNGPYPVGCTTFAVPVSSSDGAGHVVGDTKLRASLAGEGDGAKPALRLEEVAFTAFYPADITSTQPGSGAGTLQWVPSPVEGTLRGYAHFGSVGVLVRAVMYTFGGFTRWLRYPAYAHAPLLDPSHRSDAPNTPWPLVIFSHGLAGTRTSYTHFCRRLASQGRVVLALEHRDGTGPFVWTRSPRPGESNDIDKAEREYKLYVKPEDVDVGGDFKVQQAKGQNTQQESQVVESRFAFRGEQLLFRRLEVYLAHRTFAQFVNEPAAGASKMHIIIDEDVSRPVFATEADEQTFWSSWHSAASSSSATRTPRVECTQNLTLAGHSFGGATVLSVLSQPPPSLGTDTFDALPVTKAIALDPWLEPLPSPGPSPFAVRASVESDEDATPDLLVINSEGFTHWKPHFDRLKAVVEAWNGAGSEQSTQRAWLMTIVRAKHVSFSDFPLFFGFGSEARGFLDTIADVALGFLREDIVGALGRVRRASGAVVGKRFVGSSGDVVVHVP